MTERLTQSTSERPRTAAAMVSSELVGQLYASHQHGLAEVVETLSQEQRAAVALFCYGRAHLREIALAVAAMCDEWSLAEAGGKLGEAIFAQSRLQPKSADRPLPIGRRKITLAGSASGEIASPSIVVDIFDDVEEDALATA
jgi:hypothetical protein